MLKIFSRYIPLRALFLLLLDNAWITAILIALMQLRAHFLLHKDRDIWESVFKLVFITLICQISVFYNDLYDLSVAITRRELLVRTIRSFGMAAVALGLLYAAFPVLIVGKGVAAVFVGIAVLVMLGWRIVFGAATTRWHAPWRILVVGTGPLARELVRAVLDRPGLGLEIVGFVSEDPAELGMPMVNPGVIALTGDLEETVQSRKIHRVVVALEDRRNRTPVGPLLNLKLRGVQVDDAHSMYERVTGKIRTTALPPSWLIFSDGFNRINQKMRYKRVVDLLVGLPALLILSPLIALIWVLVRLESRGPAFFRQERVGLHGAPFQLLKFRSMCADAESDGVPRWSGEGDPRITRLGRILRKTRLDEIPQFWNVVKGDMSLVGPRPERPHFVRMLSERLVYYSERHAVRPGITGWAQTRYGYGATLEDALQKLEYDLFYIKNLSLLLDLVVLLETGKIVLFGRGR